MGGKPDRCLTCKDFRTDTTDIPCIDCCTLCTDNYQRVENDEERYTYGTVIPRWERGKKVKKENVNL